MSRFYSRYLQSRVKLHATHWEPKLSASCPGHKFDPKNKKPGGYRRFERWYIRPLRAKKLYWRKQ